MRPGDSISLVRSRPIARDSRAIRLTSKMELLLTQSIRWSFAKTLRVRDGVGRCANSADPANIHSRRHWFRPARRGWFREAFKLSKGRWLLQMVACTQRHRPVGQYRAMRPRICG